MEESVMINSPDVDSSDASAKSISAQKRQEGESASVVIVSDSDGRRAGYYRYQSGKGVVFVPFAARPIPAHLQTTSPPSILARRPR
jgi:hypothetical protein